MSSQVVAEWLKALRLGQYTEAFLDNGYDDLEVCKQIGNADLDAIGVVPTQHRGEITAAVSRLCQERGTELYFTLEPVSPMPCPRTAVHEFPGSGPCPCPCALGLVRKSAPGMRTEERNRGVPTTLIGHFPEPTWRREKVTFPKLRLKVMIREKLQRDGIDLGKSPYSNKDGSLGTIDDLAQQYAEYFGTHTHDVTARMEELQHRQMAQNSASFCNSKNEINLPDSDKRSSFQTFEDTSKGREETARPRPQSLKNIQNQRGSEETASCRGCGGVNFVASEIKMSDEDRIRLMNMVKDNRISIDEALAKLEEYENRYRQCQDSDPTPQHPLANRWSSTTNEIVLAGRSREQSDEDSENEGRFHRLHKLVGSSKKRSKKRGARGDDRKRSTSCGEVIPSPTTQWIRDQSWSPPFEPITHSPTTVSPRDSSCHNLLDTSSPDSLLEKASSPDSEVSPGGGVEGGDSRSCGGGEPWGASESSTSTTDSGQISSVNDWTGNGPVAGSPSVVILEPSEHVEYADRASQSQKVHSESESPITVEQTLPVLLQLPPMQARNSSFGGFDLRSRLGSTSSSGARDQDECGGKTEAEGDEEWSHSSSSSSSHGGLLGKTVKNVKKTMRKKISRMYIRALVEEEVQVNVEEEAPLSPEFPEGTKEEASSERPKLISCSSMESLRSSLSGQTVSTTDSSASARESVKFDEAEEEEAAYHGPFCGRARVHTDFTPSPYDSDSLKLKVGDIIDIISKPPMGTWMGLLHNKVGTFKFVYVDVLIEEEEQSHKKQRPRRIRSRRPKPQTVQELLARINLHEHIPAFLINGYEDLDTFKLLEERDLDELNITAPEDRAKLLTAAELLQDYDGDGDSRPQEQPAYCGVDTPRDSGCYESSDTLDNGKGSNSPFDKLYQEVTTKPGTDSQDAHDVQPGQEEPEYGLRATCSVESIVVEKSHLPENIVRSVYMRIIGDGSDGEKEECRTLKEEERHNQQCAVIIPEGQNQCDQYYEAVMVVEPEKNHQAVTNRQCAMEHSLVGISQGCLDDDGKVMAAKEEHGDDDDPDDHDDHYDKDHKAATAETRPCDGERATSPVLECYDNMEAVKIGSSIPVNILQGKRKPVPAPRKHRRPGHRSPHSSESDSATEGVTLCSNSTESGQFGLGEEVLVASADGNTNQERNESTAEFRLKGKAGQRWKETKVSTPRSNSEPELNGLSRLGSGRGKLHTGGGAACVRLVPASSREQARDGGSNRASSVAWLAMTRDGGVRQSEAGIRPSALRKTPRQPPPCLDNILERKMEEEGLDLTEEPHSDKHGRCGISSDLVRRYASEFGISLTEVAEALDLIRVKLLRKQHRMAIPSPNLQKICEPPKPIVKPSDN